ncbi:MAG: hypothetical protein GW802_34870, partial [Armatimonadetes bacterium]|nr:hypothetical protein [Armatimonadota bacterium]
MERFSSVGRITAAFAHEMRTPLHVISSTAELALEDSAEGSRERDDLSMILRNAHQASSSVLALLEFAKSGKSRLREDSLTAVVQSVLCWIEKLCQKQGILLISNLPKLPPLLMDANSLRSVLHNILVNAVEAMPEGGTLTVVTKALEDGGALLTVCDTGPGMPESVLAKAGTAFFTTKEDGTGLGLYLANRVLAEHGVVQPDRAKQRLDGPQHEPTEVGEHVVHQGRLFVERRQEALHAHSVEAEAEEEREQAEPDGVLARVQPRSDGRRPVCRNATGGVGVESLLVGFPVGARLHRVVDMAVEHRRVVSALADRGSHVRDDRLVRLVFRHHSPLVPGQGTERHRHMDQPRHAQELLGANTLRQAFGAPAFEGGLLVRLQRQDREPVNRFVVQQSAESLACGHGHLSLPGSLGDTAAGGECAPWQGSATARGRGCQEIRNAGQTPRGTLGGTTVKQIALFLTLAAWFTAASAEQLPAARTEGQKAMYTYTLLHDGTPESYDESMAVACLQGILNREAPMLYVLSNKDTRPRYWLDVLSREGGWLHSRAPQPVADLTALVRLAGDRAKGAVVWDPAVPASLNVATTIAGVADAVVLSPEYADRYLPQWNLPVLKDLRGQFTGQETGSKKNDAYRRAIREYLARGACSAHWLCLYEDASSTRAHGDIGYVLTRDWAVKNRAFVFDLSPWGDEIPGDDPEQKLGTDLETYRLMLAEMLKQSAGKQMTELAGFFAFAKYSNVPGHASRHDPVPTEWETVWLISPYNCYQNTVASDCFNQSFHSQAP